MSEKSLMLLGLMRRANAIAIGESSTGSAVRSGRAKLLLIAEDASDNARRRAEGFAAGRRVLKVELPFSKEEISAHVGVAGCSMAAVTDMGFANAFAAELAALYPERYGELAQETERRKARAIKRKSPAARKKNSSNGKRRSSV